MPADVLIIGAGVNGLMTALYLSRAGLRVTLMDRGAVAAESTWAGAGILSPLLPWHYGAAVNALAERSRRLWPEWVQFLLDNATVDPEYLASGMLVLGLADKAEAAAWCKAHGWACQVPAPAMAGVVADAAASMWLPEVAQMRNPRLGQALLQACNRAGVRILPDTPCLALESQGDRVAGVRHPGGILAADRYVVTAGAWSRELLGECALGLDIHPVRGQILLFDTTPGTVPCIVYRDGHYLVPRRDGLVLAGSTLEYAGFDKSTTAEARQELLDFAMATVPALGAAKVVRHWSGLRPGSPSNIPSIGRHPLLQNLYVNSGQFRYGVTMAPASAEMLTELMLGKVTTLDARPYAWSRA